MSGDLWVLLGVMICTHIAVWRDGYRSGQIEVLDKINQKLKEV